MARRDPTCAPIRHNKQIDIQAIADPPHFAVDAGPMAGWPAEGREEKARVATIARAGGPRPWNVLYGWLGKLDAVCGEKSGTEGSPRAGMQG